MALATAQNGSSNVADYFGKTNALADEMASAGKKLEDEEIASYILIGLNVDFNPVVSVMAAHAEPITLGELYTQLVSFEQRMDLLVGNGSQNSSMNMASHGHGGSNGRGRGCGGDGRGHGRIGGHQGARGGGNNGHRPTCQLCGKEGHTVIHCYKRFDASFIGIPDPKSASTTTTSYGTDSNWYMDTWATDHITGELDKLTIMDKYSGGDQVHTTNEACMVINQIGHSVLHTPSKDLVLKNILHFPPSNKKPCFCSSHSQR